MINHFRTLLLNRSGEEAGVGAHLGDEYVPTWYRAVPLPSYLTSVRRLLFGAAPDRVYLNYRVRQCLSLMHSSELAEFVTHLDSRITYDVADDTWLRSDAFGLRASREDVFVLRDPPRADDNSRCVNRWRVTVVDGSNVRINKQVDPVSELTAAYAMTNGISNELPLPGSQAGFLFQSSVLPGESFLIDGYGRPERSLGELAADVEHMGTAHLNSLFGVGTPLAAQEPFKTFRNLWRDHPELPYKLGGLLAAIVFQTERRRVNG
jgi:hypothetical protein